MIKYVTTADDTKDDSRLIRLLKSIDHLLNHCFFIIIITIFFFLFQLCLVLPKKTIFFQVIRKN